MPDARSVRSRAAMSDERPPRYSTVMPYRALKAAGIASRTCGSDGAMMTTLPSFLALAMSSFQADELDWAGACVTPPLKQSTSASASFKCFVMLASHQLLHPQADLFLVQDEVPIVGIEIVHARLRNDL